jgi:hypothetical protein
MPWGLIEVAGFFAIVLVLAIADLCRTQALLKKDREEGGGNGNPGD